MKTKSFQFNARADLERRGFTLIESLSVVLVLILVIAISAPSILDVVRASRLAAAGDMLAGKMVEAQGLALTFSSDVELRIYAAESSQNPEAGPFVQLLQWTHDETLRNNEDVDSNEVRDFAILKKIGEKLTFPEGVALSENSDLSSVWILETAVDDRLPQPRKYVAIRFRPDGTTDLPETGLWFMTLVDSKDALAASAPANFYTLGVDPVTANLQIYRPE